MSEYIVIGSSPAEETCAQVGQDNYRKQAMLELNAFKRQIVRTVGAPPKGAELNDAGYIWPDKER